MSNPWYGQFSFDEVEEIRAAAEKDPAIKADIQLATGNNAELTEMILRGPDTALIEALQEAEEGDQIYRDFDSVWGTGAAEHYASQYGFWDHVLEVPGAMVRGVAGAVAEFGEFAFNAHGEMMVEGQRDANEYAALLAQRRGEEVPESAPVEDYERKEWDADSLLRGAIGERKTVTGQVTEGIAQFVAPFVTMHGAGSKVGLIADLGTKGQIVAGMVVGFLTDYAFFDDNDPLVTTAIADYFGIESQFVDDYLRFDGDDSEAKKRFMRAVEGTALGGVLDTIMFGAMSAFRKYRKGQVTGDEAAREVEEVLNNADPVELSLEGQAAPSLDEIDLWHLQGEAGGRGAVNAEQAASAEARAATGETRAATDEVDVEDPTPRVESLPPKFSKVLEETQGSTGVPRVSHAEHNRAIALAKKVYIAARQTAPARAWDEAVQSLRENANTLGEASVRTKDEIAEAVIRPYNQIAGWIDTGNLDALTRFANSPGTFLDMRIRSAAMQLAAQGVRAHTEKLVYLYEGLKEKGGLKPHDEAVMREVVHKQIQFAMEIEALNTNMGSAAGAMLGQRAGHMNVAEQLTAKVREAAEKAREAGKSEAEVKKSVVSARRQAVKEMREELKANAAKSNANYVARLYRKLVKQGIEPEIAFRRVQELSKQADRAGISLNPKFQTDVEKARMAERLHQESKAEKFLRGLEQWRYNAMLSGIRTHETNFLSSAAQMTSRIAYEAAFGALRGDKAMTLAAIRKATGIVTGFKESARYALMAYKEMRPVLDEITAFERLDPVYKNHILTYPTRIMLGMDQFIKQLAYRGEVRAAALHDADLAGLTGQARSDFLDQRMSEAFTEGGAGTDMLAINRANEVTFQKHYDRNSPYASDRALAWANEVLSETYIGRLMFPFMRIFFRLTEEGIRMTPGLREGIAAVAVGLDKAGVKTGGSKFYDDFRGRNGKPAQAKAAGEFAVGIALTAWTVGMVAEGRITGNEERVYADAMLRKRVVPPYSIRIGDKWYDYSRFEPFAFPLKFWANVMLDMKRRDDAAKRGEYEGEENSRLVEAIGATAYSLAAQLSSNSFMEGIESLLKATAGSYDEGEALARPVQTMLDSYVPNILRKINESMDDSGNKYRADPVTWKAFKRHFSSVIDMEDVDLDRNLFLGEPYVYTNADDWAGHTSFVGREFPHDPVMQMLIDANYNTGVQPLLKRPTEFFRNTDLRQVPQDGGGRSLYDQYLETVSTITDANGLTYRERLAQLAENPEFQALPWGNRTRIRGTKADAIYEIKNEFEDYAQAWMENNSRSFAYLAGRQSMFERQQGSREVSALEAHRREQTEAADILGLD